MFVPKAPFAPRMLGLTLPVAWVFLRGPVGIDDMGCVPRLHPVGKAIAISWSDPGIQPDWSRLDQVATLARGCNPASSTWSSVANSLRSAARCLGPLSQRETYWLGTSWWAYHQPARHLKYPNWAPESVVEPELALRHPEGGNCESSANGHAALLTYLGIPSRTVYGRLLPSGEGHVWTISDIDGRPLAADVHLARATPFERFRPIVWRPSPAQVMLTGSYEEAMRFEHVHSPEDFSLNP